MPIWLLGVLFTGGAALLADRARAVMEQANAGATIDLEGERDRIAAECLAAERSGAASTAQCQALLTYLGRNRPASQWSAALTPVALTVAGAVLSTAILRWIWDRE